MGDITSPHMAGGRLPHQGRHRRVDDQGQDHRPPLGTHVEPAEDHRRHLWRQGLQGRPRRDEGAPRAAGATPNQP
eukprot:2220667-Prymnesium_polylepis.1